MERKRVLAEAEEPGSACKPCAEQPPKKIRKTSVTAKKLGLSKEDWGRLKPHLMKKMLKQFSKTLAKQVDANWHDGYEEQGATVAKWAMALREPLQAVLDIGVGKRLAFEQCNDVLNLLGDNWRDMCATPCRVSVAGMMGDVVSLKLTLPWGGEKTFNGFFIMRPLEDMVGFVWRALLRVGAVEARRGALATEVVYRSIKDAEDNGITLRSCEVAAWADMADGAEAVVGTEGNAYVGNSGGLDVTGLDGLVAQRENWEHLERRIRVFNMRPRIDRRAERLGEGGELEGVADDEDGKCSMQ